MSEFEQSFMTHFGDPATLQATASQWNWLKLLELPGVTAKDPNIFVKELITLACKFNSSTSTTRDNEKSFIALQLLLDFPLQERSSKSMIERIEKIRAGEPVDSQNNNNDPSKTAGSGAITDMDDLQSDINNVANQPAILSSCSYETNKFVRESLLSIILHQDRTGGDDESDDLIIKEEETKFERVMIRPIASPLPCTYADDYTASSKSSGGGSTSNDSTEDSTSNKTSITVAITSGLKPLDEKVRELASKALARLASLDFALLTGNHAQDPRVIQWITMFTEHVRQIAEIAESLKTSSFCAQKLRKARHLLLLIWRCPTVLQSPAFRDLTERFIQCIHLCIKDVPKLRGPAIAAFSSAFLGLDDDDANSDEWANEDENDNNNNGKSEEQDDNALCAQAQKFVDVLAVDLLEAIKHSNKVLNDDNQLCVILESLCVQMDDQTVIDLMFSSPKSPVDRGTVIQTFLEILQNKSLRYTTRKPAAGLLQNLLQYSEDVGYFKKKAGKQSVVPLFTALAELLEEVHEHQPTMSYIYDYQSFSMSGIVSVLIDRLVGVNLSHKVLREAVQKSIFDGLSDTQNWRKRVAALQTATYVVEYFIPEFGDVLPLLMNSFIIPMIKNDPHWMVRLAISDLIAQFSRDLPPRWFLVPYSQPLAEAILSVIDISPSSSAAAQDDPVKKKMCNDASCIHSFAICLDHLIDNLDDELLGEDEDADVVGEDINNDKEHDDDEGDIEEVEEADEDDDEWGDDEDDEFEDEPATDEKKKDTKKKSNSKKSRFEQDRKLRQSFSSLVEPLLAAVTSQIKHNVEGLSATSAEKEDMMTMERTVSNSAAAEAAEALDALNDLVGEKQTLMHVEDKLLCALMNPLSSLANIMEKSFPRNHIETYANLCLPQMKRLEQFPPGKVEFPFQALETLSVVAHFSKLKEFPVAYRTQLFEFIDKIVKDTIGLSFDISDENDNTTQEDDSSIEQQQQYKVNNFLENSAHLVPYTIRAINCLTRHLGGEMAPHLKTVMPFLIKIGNNLPTPTWARYEPGSELPENDERFTYALSVGDNNVEYLIKYDRAQWENIKSCSVSLWSLLCLKPLQPHLAMYARQLVTLFSKLLETKKDDLVEDTAAAVGEIAKILPHLKNVQARQFLAFAMLKPLTFAMQNCDDADVAETAVTASREVIPFLREWDDETWNGKNIGAFGDALHQAITFVIRMHRSRTQMHKIREQIKQQKEELKKSQQQHQKRGKHAQQVKPKRSSRRNATQQQESSSSSSSEDDDSDDDVNSDDEEFDEELSQGILKVAYETVDTFIALVKKYPKLIDHFVASTWSLHLHVFTDDVVGERKSITAKTKFFDPEFRGSKNLFYDEIHDHTIFFGFIMIVSLFEIQPPGGNERVDEIQMCQAIYTSDLLIRRLNVATDKPTIQTLSFGLKCIAQTLQRMKPAIVANTTESDTVTVVGDEEQQEGHAASGTVDRVAAVVTKERFKVHAQTLETLENDHYPQWIKFIRAYLENKAAKSKSWLEATSNVLHFAIVLIPLLDNETQKQKLFRTIIPHLPAKEDDIETPILHTTLVDWLEDPNNTLLGKGNPEVRDEDRAAVLKALTTGKVLMSDETKERLKKLL